MKLFYDFHIHSCLSPCGDNEMTPNNIVNMAVIKGLDVIAVTDHNCGENAAACIEAAKGLPLTVIPGMEIETAENVHMIALFDNIEKLDIMSRTVSDSLPHIKNKPDIFGEQILMNSKDEVVGTKEQFLITACMLDVETVTRKVRETGGVIFPAHIDKSSYSIVSNLGCVPDELMFKTVEIKNKNIPDFLNNDGICKRYNVVHNSDAHYLWDISEKENNIEVEKNDILSIINKL